MILSCNFNLSNAYYAETLTTTINHRLDNSSILYEKYLISPSHRSFECCKTIYCFRKSNFHTNPIAIDYRNDFSSFPIATCKSFGFVQMKTMQKLTHTYVRDAKRSVDGRLLLLRQNHIWRFARLVPIVNVQPFQNITFVNRKLTASLTRSAENIFIFRV